jgi:hypothetical protein
VCLVAHAGSQPTACCVAVVSRTRIAVVVALARAASSRMASPLLRTGQCRWLHLQEDGMRVSRSFQIPLFIFGMILSQTTLAGSQTQPDSLRQYETGDSLRVYVLEPVRVQGRIDDLIGLATSASQGRVGQAEVELRPLVREAELLETLPGMIVTQHSGDGKSNQMFLRGFNLDHGTDFRTEVEEMPVNLPSHAHGQGYTDLNFLIPEVVDHVEFQKGVYYADIGDFGSAGGARFSLVRDVRRNLAKLEYGENGFVRVVGVASPALGPGTLLAAGEIKGYDGAWELPQELQKGSGLGRYTWRRGLQEFSILAMAYHNEWNSSDQIPHRAIQSGTVSRLGQVDSTLGGKTNRYSLSLSWRRQARDDFQHAGVYAIYYDLDLFSNFTYFLDDSLHGDQFEQVDQRVVVGGSFEHNWSETLLGREHLWSVGLQARTDIIPEVALNRTWRRQQIRTVRNDEVLEATAGVYLQARSTWRAWLHSVLGVRGDGFYFDVASSIPENSGDATDARLSPKATLVFGPWAKTEIYLNGGLGFHSNDARGTTIRVDPTTGEPASRVDPLVTSRGAEIGIRVNPLAGLRSTVSFWLLDLDSELLFLGDAGTTEPTDRSRRWGVEWANFWKPLPWLALDADLALSEARLVDAPEGENHIPGALEQVLAAGLTLEHPKGFLGALRLRYLGEYPLIEDNSVRAKATTLVNASLGYGYRRLRLMLSVLNLLDSDENDIQYFYTSRLEGEATGGVDDVHLHPVEPRQLRGSITWWF